MNKKGQTIVYAFMLAVTVLVLALALSPPIKEAVDNARNSSSGDVIGMDCSNESISSFQKAGCLAADLSIFYFIGTLIFMVGIIAGAKIIFGGTG